VSKQIWVRPFDKNRDLDSFREWLYANRQNNQFDPDIFSYPSTKIFNAYDESGPLAFLSAFPAIILDAFAPKPGLSGQDKARCLIEIQHILVEKAHEGGIGQMYFVAEETVAAFAEGYKFKPVTRSMMNLKLADLCCEAAKEEK
jgi:hypothetical protein